MLFFQEYSFRVIVSDQVHEGTCQVTIILEDVNDNPPQINSYTFNDFVENSTDVVRVIQTVSSQFSVAYNIYTYV